MKKLLAVIFILTLSLGLAANVTAAAGDIEINVNFPGVEGVKLEYYTNVVGWKSVSGAFDGNGTVVIPAADRATYGLTTIRASKGGMSYSAAYTLEEIESAIEINIPVAAIRVYGIAAESDLAVVQSNWVYGYAPADVGVPNYFNVFDNGMPYELRLNKAGFSVASVAGINVGAPNADGYADVYFGPSYFYMVNVPDGVTDLRMQSNNWIHNKSGPADARITLLRDVGNEKTGKMSFNYDGERYTDVVFALDGTDPFGFLLNMQKFVVNFPGVKGVELDYYTNGSWKAVPRGPYDDTAAFEVPLADQATYGTMTVRASKGGMRYSVALTLAQLDAANNIDVPIATIRVYGIASACDLAVVQSNWVYSYAPADVGVSNYFNVFNNGMPYELRLSKSGFSVVSVAGIDVGAPNADCYADVYFGPSYFYMVNVPDGVTDLRMQSNNWIHNKSGPADARITLLRDVGNEKTGKMSFIYDGERYTDVVFALDGTNPFDFLLNMQKFVVNFPGIKGVELDYYTNGSWKAVPGGPYDDTAAFEVPLADQATYGTMTVRASKGGMRYSVAFTLAQLGAANNIEVPVATIRVYGIASACDLAVVQSNWVYGYAPADVGVSNYFNVFDNSMPYELRLSKSGFSVVSVAGINVGAPNADGYADVYFGPSYFYMVNVPDGVTDLRMQSNNWIHNKSGPADARITLLRDVGNEKTGKMSFVYGGEQYTDVVFALDGTNPFERFIKTRVTIAKVWQDENGEELEESPAAPEFSNGYVIGANTVDKGAQVSFEEYRTEDYELIEITVDGVEVNGVDFTADGIEHNIVFKNRAIAEAYRPNDAPITFGKLFQLASDGYIEVALHDDMLIQMIDGKFTTIPVHSKEDALLVFQQIYPLLGLDAKDVPPGQECFFCVDDIEETILYEDDDFEENIYRLEPSINGIPVEGSEIILVSSKLGVANGLFSSYNNTINSVDTSVTVPQLEAEENVIQYACDMMGDADIPASLFRDYYEIDSALVIDNLNTDREFDPLLAWRVTVCNKDFSDDDDEDDIGYDANIVISFAEYDEDIIAPSNNMTYYVAANGIDSGKIYNEYSNIDEWYPAKTEAIGLHGNKFEINVEEQKSFLGLGDLEWQLRDSERNIETRNADNQGKIFSQSNGIDSWDKSAVSAHGNFEKVYDYYYDNLYRDSYDGNGATIKIELNKKYEENDGPSPYWYPLLECFRFTSDGEYMNALDVIGHEFTHAVTQKEANLVSLNRFAKIGESNSLNEAISDIMGMLIEGKKGYARWQMGEDADIAEFYDGYNYVRDISNPTSMNDYSDGDIHNDFADHYTKIDKNPVKPHYNSTIVTHAVFRMMTDNPMRTIPYSCTDESHGHNYRTQLMTDEEWSRIFYAAIHRLYPKADFNAFRYAVINAVHSREKRFRSSDDQLLAAISEAFDDVGIIGSVVSTTKSGWQVFEHTNYTGRYSTSYPGGTGYQGGTWPRSHSIIITGAGRDVQMLGFQEEAYKDFLFKPSDGIGSKAFSFNIVRDSTDWHSIEGGGFLFNTNIDEAANKIEGYCVLYTQTGVKLIRIDDSNLADFCNGRYNRVEQFGRLLHQVNIGDPYAARTFTIMATPTQVSVYAGNEPLFENYILPTASTSFGYGPITSHLSHACSQLSYYTFSNIQASDYSPNPYNPNTGA